MASFLKGTSKKETGEGASGSRGIASYFSGIFSLYDVSSVDESSTREQRTSPRRVIRPDKDLYRSWEDLSGGMDPNKKASITSEPKADSTSPTSRSEARQELLRLQQLKGAVPEQSRQLSEVKVQQKIKKGFNWWKQASKDRDEETTKEIQDKDAQISFYRKKLDNAENLATQNLQLATDLSEKESKVEELNQQLTTLTQQMSTVLIENEKLKKLADVTDHHAQIQHWEAQVIRLQEQLTSTSDVIHTDHDCGDAQTSAMKVANLQGKIVEMQAELYKATSQALSFKTDLDRAVSHSKSQSREIIDLKMEIDTLKLEGREQCKSSSQHPEESAKLAQQSSSNQTEHDAMQVKLAQSIQTVRGLTLERQRLEEENKRLIAEAHGYANVKLDEAEKKNESLREEVSEHKKKIADMTVKLNELDTQKAACEEKNHVMANTLKSLEHTKHHLELKDVEQQAWIQNLLQDLQRVEQKASENAVLVEKYQREIQDQHKQIQELIGEKEAAKAMADIYKDDFKNEREDRERAHTLISELEKHSKAEVTNLKEQLQRVSADNVRLAKIMREREGQMKTEIATLKKQIEEENQQHDALKAERVVLEERHRELEKEVKVYSERAREAEVQSSDLRSQWIIHRDEIELTSVELGRGGWGEVIVANFRGTQVAAKCFYRALNSKYYQDMFSREINMAGRLRHPNLVQFIAAFNDDGKPIILTELMTTSLRDELEQGRILQSQVTPINLDVAKALNYLHLMKPHPIVHRDISSANVLLDPIPHNRWKAKVADYGSVNLQHKLQTVNPGSPVYIAPEAYVPTLQSPKMDIYSFGVLLVELLSGKFPEAPNRQHLIKSIKDAKYVSLIKRCLNENKDSRPSAQEIMTILSKF